MRELKVQCDCGQKFKFDVEPVNNQMPFTVACPVCGRDGTEKANMILRAQASVSAAPVAVPIPLAHAAPAPVPAPMPMASAPPPPPISAPAPAPVPAGLVPTPPAPSAAPRLRIGATAHAAPAPAAAGDGNIPPPPPPIGAMPGRLPHAAAAAAAAGVPKQTSFAKGVLGGLIGALVGSVAYYFLLKYTDLWAFRLAALGIGALAGWLAEVLGKGEGSNELGVITAVLVLAGVVGAQYLVALGWWNEFSPEKIFAEAYKEQVKEAQRAVIAVPNGTDAEIRTYLAKQETDIGIKATPDSISAEEVQEFHDKELPEYRQMASGQLTQEQYMKNHGLDALPKAFDEEKGTFKGVFLLMLLNKASIFSLIGAAGLAYKLSTNA